jgi:hypothetical protein
MDLNNIKVSPDEFKEYTGIDLKSRLTDGTGTPELFLYRVQARLNAYIDTHFFYNFSSVNNPPTAEQIADYKTAVIEEALYYFRNGDLSVDAGRDDEGGIRATREQIESLMIAPDAKLYLMRAGLWNRQISSYGFSFRWWTLI